MIHCAALVILTASASAQVAVYRGAEEPATTAEIYGQGVRESAWQAAELERQGFHLPPGFEIQLFASEPQVAKPLNMAWDRRGRMWVTSTIEYPYPAKEGTQPRDSIKILEDTDGDGAADKITTFADQLNIPIGLLPVEDGVICFSIPNLWHLKDNDGDGHVDERIKLLGPFDTTRDTHGMINALSRGSDGWIYACHGFNNQSQVTAADGSMVSLSSGNTFRFKQDGSRVEAYTRGQVNPFGMTRDQWGNWYTADCHSKPLTALLAGGCYPSFGRPHDGLGFAPDMMRHLHGSTAICGVCYYQADHFPAEYRQRFYSGNVMTSRINCNSIEWQGATATAKEQADFLTSDDSWFRPVDIQLGPDGALYVADFYNKIIGHYEVPLEHPERDRESGRIWRIVYRGEHDHAPAVGLQDIEAMISQAPLELLSSSNLTARRLAIDACVASDSLSSIELEAAVQNATQPTLLRQSALEILGRRSSLEAAMLVALLNDAQPAVQVLALRIAAEQPTVAAFASTARKLMQDADQPQVRKAAIQLVARLGNAADVHALLQLHQDLLAIDPVMAHAAKIASRQLLSNDLLLAEVCGTWSEGSGQSLIAIDDALAPRLAEVLPGLESELAAATLLGFVSKYPGSNRVLIDQALQLAARHANEALTTKLLALIDKLANGNLLDRALRFNQLCKATLVKRADLSQQLVGYGQTLQSQLLNEVAQRIAQSGRSVDWIDQSGLPWSRETRNCSDGQSASLISSLSRGEKYTGVLRSEVIDCPTELTFWLAGHNGPPAQPDHRKSLVRLSHATTGQPLKQEFPPRNDTAVHIAWSLAEFAGQPVRMEMVDADAGAAFAWLAIGRFSVEELKFSEVHELLEAVTENLLQNIAPEQFSRQLQSLDLSSRQRARLVAAALKGRGSEPLATLAQQAVALNRPELVSSTQLEDAPSSESLLLVAKELCASATTAQQSTFAASLLATPKGCALLQQLLEQGLLGVSSLQGWNAILPAGLTDDTRQYLDRQLAATKSLLVNAAIARSKAIAARMAGLDWSVANAEIGQQVFKQHCAICHKLGDEGNVIGPQLDGAIVRGATRLSEDILDPSQNVDRAFRVTSLLLDNDTVLSGLVRDEADGSVTVIKQDGKPQSISAASIAQRRQSTQSLMADNFGEVLNDEQLASLLKFLADSAIKASSSN